MFRLSVARVTVALGMLTVAALAVFTQSYAATPLPDPKLDSPLQTVRGSQTAVFAGGCFWGVDAVFKHVKGVSNVVSGYAGGNGDTAQYDLVSSGDTGHAESVRITYDPSRISYGQLLKVFFSVAHDPTQLNMQGPDRGTQYRSAIFFTDGEQQHVAQAYIAQLQATHTFSRSIVTQVTPLRAFYEAESYHQNYLAQHPSQPYIVINDLPKLANLQRQFPNLYANN